MKYEGNWLKELERESWHLELLITAFTIFVLNAALEPVRNFQYEVGLESIGHSLTGPNAVEHLVIWLDEIILVIIINLFVHLFFRGLWVAGIGLRSVTGENDIDNLGYTQYFTHYLKKRVGAFEDYLNSMDRISSMIFAFTFLLIFVLMSMAIFFLFISLIIGLLGSVIGNDGPANFVTIAIFVALMFALILYVIDFFSGGLFKRQKEFEFIYKPIYLVMSFLTLSFVYRPLYYSFLSKKITRRAVWVMIPYIILLLVFSKITLQGYSYFPEGVSSGVPLHRYYDDMREEDEKISYASIPSFEVDQPYLPLFLKYQGMTDEKVLQRICPDIQNLQEIGITLGFKPLFPKDPIEVKKKQEKILACFNELITVQLDDQIITPEYQFYLHPENDLKGLITYIYLDSIQRGRHNIQIDKLKIRMDQTGKSDTLVNVTYAVIPFEYVKQ